MVNILFVIKKTKANSKGVCPIECRITYNQKRKPFSTGLFVNPDLWNAKLQKIDSQTKESKQTNTQLSLIKQEINQAFLLLQVQKENFTIEDLYQTYKGEGVKESKTIIEVFNLHNSRMEKLIGKGYSHSTLLKFKESQRHITSFLKHEYKKNNFSLNDLTMKFLLDYDFYLKAEKSFKQITINKHIERLRKIIKLALAEGFLERDPFLLYHPTKVNNEVVYLDHNELVIFERHRFRQDRLQNVADMFVFCCYSGLAFEEMSTLKKHNIVEGFDGRKWIHIYRKKTKKNLTIPLLRRAENVLKKYEGKYETLLPVISNQNFNSFLKEIADILDIKKRITHHTARKTFATTVLLYNDIPMETVSELLGHSSMKVTQGHYAKVVQKKISKEMKRLNSKLR